MKLRVTVEGKTYEVEVEVLDDAAGGPAHTAAPARSHSATASAPAPAASSHPPASGPAASASASTSGDVVVAPIVGTVMQIKVAAGESVELNQVLLVMEAMKMETNVASPMAGKIKAIRVTPGQAVKAGQVLIEFE
jgi:glutaconyl-CoA/methylmalonyl-CoA decarboxylase subunit gamma